MISSYTLMRGVLTDYFRLPLTVKLAVTALVLGSTVTLAAEVDTSKWACESCPFERGYQADYGAGISHVSDDAAKFGDATGYDQQGLYANLDGNGLYTTDRYRLAWTIEDLGIDSRAVNIEGGRSGLYDYRIGYRELPHHIFDTTSSVFSATGNDVLTLPSGWTSSGLTSMFTTLNDSLRPVDIENERRSVTLGGGYRPSSRFKLNADYRHEERDGNDIVSGSFFTQASLLPRKLDYQTDDVDVGVSYLGNRGTFSVAYHAAWFRNKSWALTWDNPFSAAAGAERGQLAQPPDNQYQQLSLSGNYRFDAYDTVVTATTAFGKIEQHDQLLPYTINPDLFSQPLPRQSLEGSVDTTNVALTLSARPHRKAQVRLSYRHDERDNQTPRDQWQRVIVDSFISGDLQTNNPYSYERSTFNFKTVVKLIDKVKFTGGYDRIETDRDLQEVAEQTENDSWGQIQWRPRPLWEIRVKGGVAKREIDRFDTSVTTQIGQNPLLRKYNLAYRYREYGDLALLTSLPNTSITIGASMKIANDNYSQSVLGLQKSDDMSYSADIGWTVNDKTSLYVNGGWDRIDAQQTGSESFAQPDWRATHKDQFFTTSAGMAIKGIKERTDLLVDFTHSDGSSGITIDSANTGRSTFPDLESTLNALRLKLVYQRSPRLSVNMQLRYEDFSTKDWALAGVEPNTIPTVLTLGADPYDYDVLMLGVGFNYSFGKSKTELPE